MTTASKRCRIMELYHKAVWLGKRCPDMGGYSTSYTRLYDDWTFSYDTAVWDIARLPTADDKQQPTRICASSS